MIRVEQLSKRYGERAAIDAVTMDVAAGEVHGFLGANGSGKTTTLKCITGLLHPDAGRVTIADIDVAKDPVAARRQFGFLPENQYLYPELTAAEYLRFLGRLRNVPDAAVAAHGERFLRVLALAEFKEALIGGFSMGMKKKLALAGALLGDPSLVILDEPTNGMDPPAVALFKDVIRELRKRGRTVLIASHHLDFVADLADRCTLLEQGKVIARGTLEEWRQQAQLPNATLEQLFLKLTGRTLTDVAELFPS